MLVWILIACLCTIPGVGVAWLYLKHRRIEVDPVRGIVSTFMDEAPGPVKAAVISLNMLMFVGSLIVLAMLD